MSEVKCTLLGIVLAVSVFAIVFGIITLSVNRSSNTIAGRMKDSVEVEPDITPVQYDSVVYTIGD